MRLGLRKRLIRLSIALAVAAVVVGAAAWLALATPMFEKISSGLLFLTSHDGPLVTYSEPGRPSGAVLWQPTRRSLQVQEVRREYVRDDGEKDQITFRVVEDPAGGRWLASAQGSNALVPSPDRTRCFFEGGWQLYLVDTATLDVSPLTAWEYRGKSTYQLAEEQARVVHWVCWPLWSADGKSVVFGTDRSSGFEIWRIDVVNRQETVLAASGSRMWIPRDWTDDGRLLIEHYQGQAGSDFLLLDLKSGTTEPLIHGLHTFSNGAYIVAYDDVEQTSGLILCDANRRTSTPLPPAPAGYAYQMPFVVSPGGNRMALWAVSKEGDRLVAVINMPTNAFTLKTYPEPETGRSSGWLMWIDDETLGIQCGDKNDPTSATYALKVGGPR